jgi:hypothetical protein
MRTVRAGRAVVCLLAVVMLAACSSGSGTATPSRTAAQQVDATKAQAALDKSKADIRTVIDNIAVTTVQSLRRPFGPCSTDISSSAKGNQACTMFDEAAACDAGAGQEWPRRWGYNVSIQLAGSDAQPVGNSMVKALINAQWSWVRHDDPNTSGILNWSLTRAGASIHVVGDNLPGVLSVEGYGPCVGADGTVRSS